MTLKYCLLAPKWICVFLVITVTSIHAADGSTNKYSKEANTPTKEHLGHDPFRMAKLNLLWEKALKQLSEPKLKNLMKELKVQDKEELTLKKLKSELGDKEGLKEAELRKKLRAIMVKYNLGNQKAEEHEDIKDRIAADVTDQKILKAIFKDKKLNKLWNKAEASGFTEVELKALKEEFSHHQEKIDEYYDIVQSASVKDSNDINEIESNIKLFGVMENVEGNSKFDQDPTNLIREKHRELKDGYDRLHKVASTGPTSREFLEPKVDGLWKLAVKGDFTVEELESLHTELKHYEHRLLKVRHLTGQMDVLQGRDMDEIEKMESTEGQRLMAERLAKQQRKVEKLHEDLEMRILQRHLEL